MALFRSASLLDVIGAFHTIGALLRGYFERGVAHRDGLMHFINFSNLLVNLNPTGDSWVFALTRGQTRFHPLDPRSAPHRRIFGGGGRHENVRLSEPVCGKNKRCDLRRVRSWRTNTLRSRCVVYLLFDRITNVNTRLTTLLGFIFRFRFHEYSFHSSCRCFFLCDFEKLRCVIIRIILVANTSGRSNKGANSLSSFEEQIATECARKILLNRQEALNEASRIF